MPLAHAPPEAAAPSRPVREHRDNAGHKPPPQPTRPNTTGDPNHHRRWRPPAPTTQSRPGRSPHTPTTQARPDNRGDITVADGLARRAPRPAGSGTISPIETPPVRLLLDA